MVKINNFLRINTDEVQAKLLVMQRADRVLESPVQPTIKAAESQA